MMLVAERGKVGSRDEEEKFSLLLLGMSISRVSKTSTTEGPLE